MMAQCTVEEVGWPLAAGELAALRHAVFVVEQGVPVELEVDALDPASRHVAARNPRGEVVGTGRLTPDGRIGRMAVARDWRGRGVGRALLERLVGMAREAGYERVVLHAQTQAVDFYRAAGFAEEGLEFMDAGIAHVTMVLRLHRETP